MRKLFMVVPAVLMMTACADDGPVATPVDAGLRAEMAAQRAPASLRQAPAPTIVDVALAVNAETGEFSTLIAAVVAADLVDVLSAVGQRTVFAPTDAAFGELGLNAGNIGDLDAAVLRNILLYHVTTGRRNAASVVGAKQIRMANGGFTQITVEGGPAINGAPIVATDVEASNGLIHIIGGVLLP